MRTRESGNTTVFIVFLVVIALIVGFQVASPFLVQTAALRGFRFRPQNEVTLSLAAYLDANGNGYQEPSLGEPAFGTCPGSISHPVVFHVGEHLLSPTCTDAREDRAVIHVTPGAYAFSVDVPPGYHVLQAPAALDLAPSSVTVLAVPIREQRAGGE